MLERLSGHTRLTALLAAPARHSLSPKMHNAAYAKLGLDYAYLAFEVDNSGLAAAVQGMRALGICGANVSMPNKQAIVDRKSTRLNSSHANISYAVFCLKKK